LQNTITTKNFASDLHIARLDTIRFLAALWVAIFHGAIPLKPLADHGFIRLGLAFVEDSFDGIGPVDAIKIDVQGFEVEAIRGLSVMRLRSSNLHRTLLTHRVALAPAPADLPVGDYIITPV
jgi:hypothetical protein